MSIVLAALAGSLAGCSDDSSTAAGGNCGTEMPPPENKAKDSLLAKAERDQVRAWIVAGAKKDAAFTDQVVPIIQRSCALSACHAAAQSNLGIQLTNDAEQIYTSMQGMSPTAKGVPFVAPGNPDNSFLLLKIEATQQKLAAKCPVNGPQTR